MTLDGISHAPGMRVTATPGSKVHLSFKANQKETGTLDFEVPKACSSGLGIVDKPIPPSIASAGFDTILVSAAPAAQPLKLGGVLLNGVEMTGPAGKKGKLVFDKEGCALPNHGEAAAGACSVVARAGSGIKGHLTYGPYLSLEPGGYIFELEYKSSAPHLAPAGEWDAALRAGPVESVLGRGGFTGTENATGVSTGQFWVPPRQTGVVEIRTSAKADVDTEVTRLRVYAAIN
jgi:hypothetical protein